MVNKSKVIGTKWESSIVDWIKQWWPHADRLTLSGSKDRGDIRLGDGIKIVIEAKNEKAITLASYLQELKIEMQNAGAEIGAVFVKRRGKSSPGDAYVVMTGDIFVKLLREAGYDARNK